jgi:hypothetical protein
MIIEKDGVFPEVISSIVRDFVLPKQASRRKNKSTPAVGDPLATIHYPPSTIQDQP